MSMLLLSSKEQKGKKGWGNKFYLLLEDKKTLEKSWL